MEIRKNQVKILKNIDNLTIEEMLNDGWILNNIVVLPYSNYHGIINASTIEKEFYFIRELIIGIDFSETDGHNSMYREL